MMEIEVLGQGTTTTSEDSPQVCKLLASLYISGVERERESSLGSFYTLLTPSRKAQLHSLLMESCPNRPKCYHIGIRFQLQILREHKHLTISFIRQCTIIYMNSSENYTSSNTKVCLSEGSVPFHMCISVNTLLHLFGKLFLLFSAFK